MPLTPLEDRPEAKPADRRAKSISKRLGRRVRVDSDKHLKDVRRRVKSYRQALKAKMRDSDGGKSKKNVRNALARHREMREPSTQKIYDLQSKVYDVTFGRLVRKRIGKAIVEQVDLQPGQVALDVGIGTGGSLEFWPSEGGTVIGIDLSGGMLGKAADKLDETERGNVALSRANALGMPFPDDAFDSVFVSHVVTVVSDPAALIAECRRVAKPGAKIVIVNHFQSENKLMAAMEKLACPICTKLGWKSDLALDDLVKQTGMNVVHRYKLTTPDLWETVVIQNDA